MGMAASVQRIVDNCRFFWMCRHICPVGNATGTERNNARGRALNISLVNRGYSFTEDMVDNVYECALCAACTANCATGFDPTRFVKAARMEAAAEGLIPEPVVKILASIAEYGNPYEAETIDPDLQKEIASLPRQAPVLLYLGSTARYLNPKAAVTAIKLLKKAGISFTVLQDEPDSGLYKLNLLGPVAEARNDLVKAAEGINATKAETLVAFSPESAKAFLRDYPEQNVSLTPKIRTFTSFIRDLIAEGALKPRRSRTLFTYHDPCTLARDLEEESPPREIISACGSLKEMYLRGKNTVCCGSGLLALYKPELTEKTAAVRWQSAKETGAEVLVTACPACHNVFAKTKPKDMELCGLETVVWEACK